MLAAVGLLMNACASSRGAHPPTPMTFTAAGMTFKVLHSKHQAVADPATTTFSLIF